MCINVSPEENKDGEVLILGYISVLSRLVACVVGGIVCESCQVCRLIN